MDFFSALEHAKSEGVDVDTFIRIWEVEAKAKLLALEGPEICVSNKTTSTQDAPVRCSDRQAEANREVSDMKENIQEQLPTIMQETTPSQFADAAQTSKICKLMFINNNIRLLPSTLLISDAIF